MTPKEAQAISENLCSNAFLLAKNDELLLVPFRHTHRLKLREAMEKLTYKFGYDATK